MSWNDFCIACEEGADCVNGTISTSPGFWTPSLDSLRFYECKSADVCQGRYGPGLVPEENRDVQCLEGHSGPLCAVCTSGYAVVQNKCEPCLDNEGGNYALLLLTIVVVSIVLVLIVKVGRLLTS